MMLVIFLGFEGSVFYDLLQTLLGNDNVFNMYRYDLQIHRALSREETLAPMSKLHGRTILDTDTVIFRDVLPHLNGTNGAAVRAVKLFYIAKCSVQLILFREGFLKASDRDSRIFARIACPNTTVAMLFRMEFLGYIRRCLGRIRNNENAGHRRNTPRMLHHEQFTRKIHTAFATGNWSKVRQGVSQCLQTFNLHTQTSQLRRINSSALHQEGNIIAPRLLHTSSAGYECASETPEGKQCGLVTNMAITTGCTNDTSEYSVSRELSIVAQLADAVGLLPLSAAATLTGCEYLVYGEFGMVCGYVSDIDAWIREFDRAKRALEINPYVTYYKDTALREWHLFAERGRMIRPLFVLENLYKLAAIFAGLQAATNGAGYETLWADLAIHGCIEYVCPGMEANLRVAEDVRIADIRTKTHLEITQVAFFGIIAAHAVFFAHNQSPRHVYQTSMQKQCIAQHDMRNNRQTTSHRLMYGQRALVHTNFSSVLHTDALHDVTNVTIAVMPLASGQEDAIILNRAAVECGLFSHSVSRTYVAECPKNTTYFTNPASQEWSQKPVTNRKPGAYGSLRANGISAIGAYLKGGDVITGRLLDIKNPVRFASTGPGEGREALVPIESDDAHAILSAASFMPVVAADGGRPTKRVKLDVAAPDKACAAAAPELSVYRRKKITLQRQKDAEDNMARHAAIRATEETDDTHEFGASRRPLASPPRRIVERSTAVAEDRSVVVREYESGIVSRVDIATTPKGTVVTTYLTEMLTLELGDKLASRHSQKGVVGELRNREDMPFSISTGLPVDVVVSSLGLASRMTVGQIYEIVTGKAVCLTGDYELGEDRQDAFASCQEGLACLKRILKKAGFKTDGTEVFYNGETGERIRGSVLTGVIAYQKLKHLASQKVKARSTGPVHALTRQPTEGRRKCGGLRFGSMEIECVLAHATAEILAERTLIASDMFKTFLCNGCGNLAEGYTTLDFRYCRTCDTGDKVAPISIGYSTKLMMQELAATGIKVAAYAS